MRQSGHLQEETVLNQWEFYNLLAGAIDRLDVEQARKDAIHFVKTIDALAVWSKDFFRQISEKIQIT